jgi:hypothetical protein
MKVEMRTHDYWPKVKMADGKKRRVRIIRPTLREIGVRARILHRNACALRGRLRKTADATGQLEIGKSLTRIRGGMKQIRGYIASFNSPTAPPILARA